jgi:hypothetical protein
MLEDQVHAANTKVPRHAITRHGSLGANPGWQVYRVAFVGTALPTVGDLPLRHIRLSTDSLGVFIFAFAHYSQ